MEPSRPSALSLGLVTCSLGPITVGPPGFNPRRTRLVLIDGLNGSGKGYVGSEIARLATERGLTVLRFSTSDSLGLLIDRLAGESLHVKTARELPASVELAVLAWLKCDMLYPSAGAVYNGSVDQIVDRLCDRMRPGSDSGMLPYLEKLGAAQAWKDERTKRELRIPLFQPTSKALIEGVGDGVCTAIGLQRAMRLWVSSHRFCAPPDLLIADGPRTIEEMDYVRRIGGRVLRVAAGEGPRQARLAKVGAHADGNTPWDLQTCQVEADDTIVNEGHADMSADVAAQAQKQLEADIRRLLSSW